MCLGGTLREKKDWLYYLSNRCLFLYGCNISCGIDSSLGDKTLFNTFFKRLYFSCKFFLNLSDIHGGLYFNVWLWQVQG